MKPLESVIEEEASEIETPASEVTNKHNRNKGNLHRKQTSIMSSKRASSAGHPLEEDEGHTEISKSTFLAKLPSKTKVVEEQGGPITNDQ